MSISFELNQQKYANQELSRNIQDSISQFFNVPKRGSISLAISNKGGSIQVQHPNIPNHNFDHSNFHKEQILDKSIKKNPNQNINNNNNNELILLKNEGFQKSQVKKLENNDLIDIDIDNIEVVQERILSKDFGSSSDKTEDTSKKMTNEQQKYKQKIEELTQQQQQTQINIQELPVTYMNSMDEFITNIVCQNNQSFMQAQQQQQKQNQWLCHGNLGYSAHNVTKEFQQGIMNNNPINGNSLSIALPNPSTPLQNPQINTPQQQQFNNYGNQLQNQQSIPFQQQQSQQQQQQQPFQLDNIHENNNNNLYNQNNQLSNSNSNNNSNNNNNNNYNNNYFNNNKFNYNNNKVPDNGHINNFNNGDKNNNNKEMGFIKDSDLQNQNDLFKLPKQQQQQQYNQLNNNNNLYNHQQQSLQPPQQQQQDQQFQQQQQQQGYQQFQNQQYQQQQQQQQMNQHQQYQRYPVQQQYKNQQLDTYNNQQNQIQGQQMNQQQQLPFIDPENSINILLPILQSNQFPLDNNNNNNNNNNSNLNLPKNPILNNGYTNQQQVQQQQHQQQITNGKKQLKDDVLYQQQQQQYQQQQGNSQFNLGGLQGVEYYRPPQDVPQEEDSDVAKNYGVKNINSNNNNQTKIEAKNEYLQQQQQQQDGNQQLSQYQKGKKGGSKGGKKDGDGEQKDKRLNTSHVPINMLNNLIKYLIPLYQIKIPCTCQNQKQQQQQQQGEDDKKCSRCIELQNIQTLKKNRCKNIQSFGNFWAYKRIRYLSEQYFLSCGPYQIQSKNYRSDNNRQALYRCLPAFLDGVRNHKLFWKLI